MADLELDTYGRKMEVEVSVRAGDIHGVQLTCVVQIEDYTDRARAAMKLRGVIETLRNALPVVELKSDERDWRKKPEQLGIDVDGKMVSMRLAPGHVKAAQEELKRRLGK
jgi:hypothetical protein